MNWLSVAARIAQITMGSVFLLAGALKIWEPVLFYWDVIPYTQMLGLADGVWEWAVGAALLIAPLECVIGAALVANWKPRVTIPVASLLMLVFLLVTFYAWRTNALGPNCGCFGSLVERTPAQAVGEDLVFVLLMGLSWWGLQRHPRPSLQMANWIVGVVGIVALVVGSYRFFPQMDRTQRSDLQVGVALTGLPLQGSSIDLTEGEYLVELFSPKCGHCIEAVPHLNELAESNELPAIVALSSYPLHHPIMVDFKLQNGPRYTVAAISRIDFLRLTTGHSYPRLAYVRNGTVQGVWESGAMPTLAELIDYVKRDRQGD